MMADNNTAEPLPDFGIVTQFEKQVANWPDAIAIETEGQLISYAELSRRANETERLLADKGVLPGDRVGILMECSATVPVAQLGAAKAGVAYVPLSSRDPASRMRTILRRTGCSLLMADEASRDHEVARGHETLHVPAGTHPAWPRDEEFRNVPQDPDALLYIMHTSGSTGDPKGVKVTHRNVLALALDRVWRGGAHERVLFHSPHAFDASTYELWVPLLSGGRVVVAPQRIDATLLRTLIHAERITALWLPAGLFNALAIGDPGCLDGAREVWVGGDVVSAHAVSQVVAACPDITLYNGYGPTETTTFATCHRIHPGPPVGENVPIGRPLDHTRTYVLDERLQLLPDGATGELYVAGAGVALGYEGRPDLTQKRFLPDPYGSPGERMYATGDLACRDEGGNLRYHGRADRQVKINGFRVEPAEIEATLGNSTKVSQVVVTAERTEGGSGRVVAYVVPTGPGKRSGPDSIRREVREKLPDFMVPAEVVFLSEIPLTENGKVDRGLLLELVTRNTESAFTRETDAGTDHERTRRDLSTPTERRLAEMWSQLLEAPVTSRDASFWDLGGHSLRGVTLLARIREHLGVRLRLRDLFSHPVLSDLAGLVDAETAPHDTPVSAQARQECPPSGFQRQIWLAQALDPRPGLYNVPFAWRLIGRLDPDRLVSAFDRVVARHEALRTTFAQGPEGLQQVVGQPTRTDFNRDRCDTEAGLVECLRAEADRAFDVAAGPLLRAGLIDTPNGQVLTLTIHHIVFDVASLPILLDDLRRHYAAQAGEIEAPSLEGAQFRDLMAAVEQPDPGALGRCAERLRDAPAELALPAPAEPEPHGDVPLDLPDDLLARMRPLQEKLGMSWFMVSAAALAGLLHRWTGSSELTFGFPADLRDGGEFQTIVGPCLNTVVVRSSAIAQTTVAELLETTRDGVLDAIEDRNVSFDAVVQSLNPPRSAGGTPYLDVVLAPQVRPAATPRVGDCELIPLAETGATGTVGKFALTVGLTVAGDRVTGTLQYRGDRLSRSVVRDLARSYRDFLTVFVNNQEHSLGALPVPGNVPTTPSATIASHAGNSAGSSDTHAAREAEQRIGAMWATLLGVDDIGVDDNFFDRGGDSLQLVTLHAELCRTFNVELPVQRLFDSSTIRAMAHLVTATDPVPATEPARPGALDPEARGAARRRMRRRAGRG